MKLCLLFPGQGSQSPGMGQFLFDEFSYVRAIFEEASDTLSKDIKKLCFEDPDQELNLTQYTQPALLTVSYAVNEVLNRELDIEVSYGAGHSIGEYSAMAGAGVFSLAKGVELVHLRGKFMQEAVPVGTGGMSAVMGLTPKQVTELCLWTKENAPNDPVIEPANYNSPVQTVISGHAEGLAWLRSNAPKDLFEGVSKIKLIPLKVSAPFHCSLMKPAQDKMAMLLEATSFEDPKWSIVQNYTAEISGDITEMKQNLIQQVSGSVRWVQSLEQLGKQEFDAYIECGHGKVLTGLLKKIDSETRPAFNVNSIEDLKALEERLNS